MMSKTYKKLGLVKECLKDLIEQEEKDAATKLLAKNHLEGENQQVYFAP